MGDVAKGIKSFKSGLADEDDKTKTIDQSSDEVAATVKTEDKQTS
ncbi:UNVERIFIED_CONTAM: hypothetical protein GTU68_057040 [Idotea baltica]|nr:hypothetical protein [Idotea baltica]